MDNALAVPAQGSILSVADSNDPQDVSQALSEATTVILCDRSGSMSNIDAPQTKPRYVLEDEMIEALQRQYSGKIVLISFASLVEVELAGHLPLPSGSTEMANALQVAKEFIDIGLEEILLISDGDPSSPEVALRTATELKGLDGKQIPVRAMYIGPHDDDVGKSFMKEIARRTGGTYQLDPQNEEGSMLKLADRMLTLKAGR